MYCDANATFVGDRQRAYLRAATDHRLVADRERTPRVRRPHGLGGWIRAAQHLRVVGRRRILTAG
jgi:hypothetical protein